MCRRAAALRHRWARSPPRRTGPEADRRRTTPGVVGRDDRRYAITDLLDDLAGSDDQSERLFIATELVRRTGELALAVGGSWGGGGKWLARRLETTAPGLSTRLHHGLQEVLDGRVETLVAVVDEVLGRTGGRLWFGYKRVGAP